MMLDRFQSEILTPTLLHDHLPHLPGGAATSAACPLPLTPSALPVSYCFEVFDYEYAQMLCEQGIPLLFVDSPVTELKAPLKADLLYMDNHVEIQHFIQIMHQRGKDRIGFIGEIGHCQSFFRAVCRLCQCHDPAGPGRQLAILRAGGPFSCIF